MPNIANHQSSHTTKLLLIGHSGTGKTGALASLASAGFKLRILDLDNGIDILRSYLTDPNSRYYKENPKCAENVEYVTLTETKKSVNGRVLSAKSTVWPKMVSLLDHWKDGDTDLGKPSSWGSDTVLVLDSLTAASKAALDHHLQMNGALMSVRTQNEARRDIGAAQDYIRSLLDLFKDEGMKCNIIVISHITEVSESGYGPQSEEAKNESSMGFPSAIGRALSPHIPRYFNTVLHAKAQGPSLKIYTKTTGEVCTKNTAPLRVAQSYSIEDGLAQYFKAVQGAK
jgi:hypothetical protein